MLPLFFRTSSSITKVPQLGPADAHKGAMGKLQWRGVKTTGPRKSRCDAEAIKRHKKVFLHAGGENDGRWWGVGAADGDEEKAL